MRHAPESGRLAVGSVAARPQRLQLRLRLPLALLPSHHSARQNMLVSVLHA